MLLRTCGSAGQSRRAERHVAPRINSNSLEFNRPYLPSNGNLPRSLWECPIGRAGLGSASPHPLCSMLFQGHDLASALRHTWTVEFPESSGSASETCRRAKVLTRSIPASNAMSEGPNQPGPTAAPKGSGCRAITDRPPDITARRRDIRRAPAISR